MFGPLGRFDPHTPPYDQPAVDPAGRSVVYLAENLVTALGEVFAGGVFAPMVEAAVCPRYRVALVRPVDPIMVLNLRGQSMAMKIGALPQLSMGQCSRELSQEWARAIYDDRAVVVKGKTIHGVYYGTAHTSGGALALWDTAGKIEVVTGSGGPQDFPLDGPVLRSRIVTGLDSINMYPTFVSSAECVECQNAGTS